MPISYSIDPGLRLLKMRLTGEVSVPDLRRTMKSIMADPRFTAELRVLGDVRGIDARFTSSDLVQYQAWRKTLPRFGRMAIVTSNEYEYGMARMFEQATGAVGGTAFRVFRDMQEARAWLDLPAT